MTSNSVPIAYEDHELNVTSNDNRSNPVQNAAPSSSTKVAEDSSSKLALVPLHPACKKQKLESKQLPIVLGRTNLASWWWKSCPCQHYCRLHCRPVAQNIRSLSKVMIQIDTAGRIHIVGKNPHLVTITPERQDQLLQVNDILSIGRRDREPWMRFQVIRKQDSSTQLPPRKQKTHTPEWMARQTNKRGGTINSNSNSNNNAATAPKHHASSNRRTSSPPSLPQSNTNNPPEWITTHSRKRKSSSASRCTSSKQQQQRAISTKLMKAAYAAASDTLQQTYARGRNMNNTSYTHLDSDSNAPPRKKRRSREVSDKKISRGRDRCSRNDSIRKPTEEVAQPHVEHDHHPQVHLVFQDYETSAMLVRATQRKKRHKSSSSRNNGSSDGKFGAPRAFLTDETKFGKTQLRLLSKNFAAALLGAVKPTAPNDQGIAQDAVPVNSENRPESQEAYATAEASLPEYDTKPSASKKDPVDRQLDAMAESKQIAESILRSKQKDAEEAASMKSKATPEQNETSHLFSQPAEVKQEDSQSNPAKGTQVEGESPSQFQESILSLPQCASSTFDPNSLEVVQPGTGFDPIGDASSSKSSSNASDEESEGSPASSDPRSSLSPWRNIVEREPEGSFRHALASLIVAKNEGDSDRQENGLLWLPDLLEDGFQLEPTPSSSESNKKD